MKSYLFIIYLCLLTVYAVLPSPVPPRFNITTHTATVSENNISRTNYFSFNCPYSDKDIAIKHVNYKIDTNSSNFTVVLYHSNWNSLKCCDDPNGYWQIFFQQCSYSCEGNYTLNFQNRNATMCFIWSGSANYNYTMDISYEIEEVFEGPIPQPSLSPTPENPPYNTPEPVALSIGAIIGIIVGCVVSVALFGGLTYYFIKKYNLCNHDASRN